MRESNKKILLIEPSVIIARGIESVLNVIGGFEVTNILQDIGPNSDVRLSGTDADMIIVDPIVFDYSSRLSGRDALGQFADVPVVLIQTIALDESILNKYDAVINLYDKPADILQKLRAAINDRPNTQRGEGEELSSREKEILVCVAKGMLNKEIADHFNISIYTVITHRKNITRKTGIKTVAGLTVYALLNNLIDINSMEME